MATQLQIRRGTTAQMNAFTGAEGELAVNTSTDTVHVHNGATAGGFALARADGSNIATYAGSFTTLAASSTATLNTLVSSGATLTGGTINGVTVGATTPSTGAFTTVSASGAITGNVTGNLTGNVTGDVTGAITGNVTGNLTGSVLTAAQTNITSVGTLSGLTVTGTSTLTDKVSVGAAGNATYALQVKKDIDAFAVKIENDGNSAGTSGNSYADASDGLWVDTRWNTATNTPFQVTTNSGNTPIIVAKGNGSVGIGVSNPSDYYANNLVVGAGSEGGITIASSATTYNNYLAFADSSSSVARYAGLISYDHNINAMHFRTNSQERMRIDSSGNLSIGTTVSGNSRLKVAGSAVSQPLVQFESVVAGDLSNPALYLIKKDNSSGTNQTFVRFVINSGMTANGQINGNGAGAVAFGSWSDSRLKENITDLPNQLANITALRPVDFDYIESEGGGYQIGFIAQEVEEIYPDLVGEREDGMKTLAGMGKMEARLIKAIQEQQAIIESQATAITDLTTRLTALENN